MDINKNSEDYKVRLRKRRNILSRYRLYVVTYCSFFYLTFNLVDWFYKPEFALRWLLYRILFVIYIFIVLHMLKLSKVRRNALTPVAISPPILGCWFITAMLAESGGVHSAYLPGLILMTTVFLGLFRLSSLLNLIVSLICFVPAIFVILDTAKSSELNIAFIQIAFLLTAAIINCLSGASDGQIEAAIKKIYLDRENIRIRLAQEAMLHEIQVLQNESLREIGIQVAHDVASPLTALRVLAKHDQFAPDVRQLLEQTVQRTVMVVEDLRSSYKNPITVSVVIDPLFHLKKVIQEKNLISEHEIILQVDNTKSLINASATQLERIFSNLLDNALQAAQKNLSPIEVRCNFDGKKAEIIFTDRGIGISEEHIASLGQKGFTHGKINGSGYGLFHAFSYMKQIGGEIKITSSPGVGTTVILIFRMET